MLNLQRTIFNGPFQTWPLSCWYNLIMNVEQTNVKFFSIQKAVETLSLQVELRFMQQQGIYRNSDSLFPLCIFFSWLIPFYSHVTLAWSVKFPQKQPSVCAYFFPHLSYNLEGAFTVEECLFPLLPQVACSQVSQLFGTKLAHSLLNQSFSSFI